VVKDELLLELAWLLLQCDNIIENITSKIKKSKGILRKKILVSNNPRLFFFHTKNALIAVIIISRINIAGK